MKNILVIDDEDYIIEVVNEILDTVNYLHSSYTDPKEGISAYKKQWNSIDLVILDYAMPQLNGKDVLIELRKINPEVKVIINTGYSKDEIDYLMNGIHANAFIQKPNTPDEFLALVQKILTTK